MTASAAARSVVGSRARSTSSAKVTTPTRTSSGTVSRKVSAASFAASKRSPRMELLVSMTRIVVRSTAVVDSAGTASASASAPSTVTLTLSRSTSLPSGTDTSSWTPPGLGSACVIDASSAACAGEAATGTASATSTVETARTERRAIRCGPRRRASGRR